MELQGRNVNHLYRMGIDYLRRVGMRQNSRAGDVIVAPHPVMSIYERPRERVLFDPTRDANPFFHFFESLWMLDGKDDGLWLDLFVKDFSKRFAEQNGNIYGAYGERWRSHFDMDQLKIIVDRLSTNPDDRRVVLTMWDPVWDLIDPQEWDPQDPLPKDLPCNTHAYPRIVDGSLDLTICCRSNDIIWGAYGANAVHFSVLQEYLAAGIGCSVGRLYQLSNNFHAYVEILERQEPHHGGDYLWEPYPVVQNFARFNSDLFAFMNNTLRHTYSNSFFPDVAIPMMETVKAWRKDGVSVALSLVTAIRADDWREACLQWLLRRAK